MERFRLRTRGFAALRQRSKTHTPPRPNVDREHLHGALAQESPVAVAREVVETGRPSQQPWRVARELGWQALTVPEDCGGLGLGAVELLPDQQQASQFVLGQAGLQSGDPVPTHHG